MMKRMLCGTMMILGLLICTSAVNAQQLEADVVYETPELLTKTMLRKHALLVQLLLDVQYSPEQTAKHYRLIKEYWEKNDHAGIKSIETNLAFYDRLMQMPAEEQRAAILQFRPVLIQSLVEDAATHEDAKWYLENYYNRHLSGGVRAFSTLFRTAAFAIRYW